jgi:septum formation protein
VVFGRVSSPVKTLILASSSPYRRDLLSRLGLTFEAIAPDVDESPQPRESPAEVASRLARAKATAIERSDAVIIGSDQVASLDGRLLGKPGNRVTALEQLESCQGREVVFATAACVLNANDRRTREHVDRTRVRFRRRSRAELERYLDRESAIDCAGGFKAEGLGIALFEAIETSDPTALIGLPLIWLADALKQEGLDPLAPTG